MFFGKKSLTLPRRTCKKRRRKEKRKGSKLSALQRPKPQRLRSLSASDLTLGNFSRYVPASFHRFRCRKGAKKERKKKRGGKKRKNWDRIRERFGDTAAITPEYARPERICIGEKRRGLGRGGRQGDTGAHRVVLCLRASRWEHDRSHADARFEIKYRYKLEIAPHSVLYFKIHASPVEKKKKLRAPRGSQGYTEIIRGGWEG